MQALPISYLFVPGDRPDRFAKAAASGADVVVLDLEDAVSPANKSAARAAVAQALAGTGLRACVRINGTDTEWFADDCAVLRSPGVAAVMLPKAETREGIAAVRAAAGEGVPILPIIETARGLAHAAELAACPGVMRLAFGSADFQVDLGIEADGLELLFARSQIVLASRLGGVAAPLDGVTLEVKDAEQVRHDALRARRMGFGGKLCIHPAQVAAVKDAFAPDARMVDWARGVLSAASSTAAGALTYEGKMIDKPVLDRARAILARVA
ncbi:MAG TPA: CoA ester lyase [Ramlibacter sp.]|nr:CoA ester lyase [Ramlibacter sp.]